VIGVKCLAIIFEWNGLDNFVRVLFLGLLWRPRQVISGFWTTFFFFFFCKKPSVEHVMLMLAQLWVIFSIG